MFALARVLIVTLIILFGALLAFAGLSFCFSRLSTFTQYWVPIDVALLFVLGALLSSRSNSLRRLLTTQKFRSEAVRTHAAAMFYEAGIANTDAEMGVLIYLSILERRLELIADRGVLKGVNALEWNQVLFELHEAGRERGTASTAAMAGKSRSFARQTFAGNRRKSK